MGPRCRGATFELASTVSFDPNLLTVADLEHIDLEHGEPEERWLSVGIASSGALLAVAYLWSVNDPAMIKVRLISARKATPAEREQYQEGL